VTEVHWRIIANLGFKLRSYFTAHCVRRAACGRIISRHARLSGFQRDTVYGGGCFKLAFHDADTDTDFLARILADSPDTPTSPRKSSRECRRGCRCRKMRPDFLADFLARISPRVFSRGSRCRCACQRRGIPAYLMHRPNGRYWPIGPILSITNNPSH